TIPSWLNDRAISMGINFSQALQEALLSKIQA
ncbi:MAG: HicB family protein, partial [Lachnospiraceae bacterium]|nr:HicB family protein [Lachnospiraceae bacterium]